MNSNAGDPERSVADRGGVQELDKSDRDRDRRRATGTVDAARIAAGRVRRLEHRLLPLCEDRIERDRRNSHFCSLAKCSQGVERDGILRDRRVRRGRTQSARV